MGGTMLLTRPRPPDGAEVPSRPHRSADGVVCLALWVAAAAWFLWLTAAASASGVLTGEEASVALRDPIALPLHWQASIWSTNVGGAAFYGLVQYLHPDLGLLSVRPAKAVATALLAPLVFLVARRRLGCFRIAAAVGGVTTALLPGVSTMSWIAIETPLDTVCGAAALFLVTSPRRWWPAGLVLAGLAISIYTAGLAWAAAVVLVALWRTRSVSQAGAVAAAGLGGTVAVLWPLAWWHNGGVVVTGGGRNGPDPHATFTHVAQLGRYLVVNGESYYYFSRQPMLGAWWFAALLALAVVVAAYVRWHLIWPWLLIGAACAGLYAVSSGVPGSRRVVALCVVAALAAAVVVDQASTGRGSRRRVTIVAAGSAVLVAAACAPGTATWRHDITSGVRRLSVDWPLHPDPAGVAATLDRLDRDLRDGRVTALEVARRHGGTRTLGVIWALHRHPVPPFPAAEMIAVYRQSPDRCALDGGCIPSR